MTTWTLQDLTTPEEDEAWARMSEAQQQQEEQKQPRSFWNLRIVRMPRDQWGGEWLEIQEVYYNKQGQPCGYCNSFAGGENMDEIKEQLKRHEEALALPILDSETDFKNQWEDDCADEY